MIYLYSCKRCKTGVRMDYPIKGRPGCYYRQTESGQVGAGIWINATYPDGRRDYGGAWSSVQLDYCPQCSVAPEYRKQS